ncbi:MAG: helicase HerA-like domain-containing protein [Nakamurella sp.]
MVDEQPITSADPSTAAGRAPAGSAPAGPDAPAPLPTVTDAASPPVRTSEATQRIAHGYDTTSPCVTLGSVLVGEVCDPSALVRIPLAMFNRHGLVAGATGTGKTKSLQVIAEQLSAAGVPVMMPDIKGDLSGLATAGASNDRIVSRAQDTGDDWRPTAFPTEFLALAGQGTGVPIRATIDSFGPILLSKVLDLNDTQESTLGLIFHWADTKDLPLLDIKDLRAVIAHLTSDEGKADLKELGGVSSSTAGVILRAITNLEAQGGDQFFGEPEFEVGDLLRTDAQGRGIISLLEVTELQSKPALYSTFIMWLLSELFEHLDEVGDVDRPKIVFMFDESHLLFADASKAFLQAVEQTVKLIRSKGVGVFFCSQLPTDIPDSVLSQLGARIQHALRAFTPNDQQALSKTVRTYPRSEDYDLETALTSLGTGEAIVTVLSEKGAPTPVAWTRVRAPRSLMAPSAADVVAGVITASTVQPKYSQALDRESAYEKLTQRLSDSAQTAPGKGTPIAPPNPDWPTLPSDPSQFQPQGPATEFTPTSAPVPSEPAPAPRSAPRAEPQSEGGGLGGMLGGLIGSTAGKSFLRSLGTAIGGTLGRNVFGTRRRRR